VSYLLVAGLLFWVSRYGTVSPPVPEAHHEGGLDVHGLPAGVAD
jgi:hypothetical protein